MIQTVGRIVNGEIVPLEEMLWLNELKRLSGREVEIVIIPRPKRTLNQNAYYWGTIVYMIWTELKGRGLQASDLSTRTGDLLRNDVHDFLRSMFAQREKFNIITEEVEIETISTKDMTSIEFTNYVERIRQWAAEELGLEIPDPNEQD
jgi:nitrogen regulatory protein PII